MIPMWFYIMGTICLLAITFTITMMGIDILIGILIGLSERKKKK